MKKLALLVVGVMFSTVAFSAEDIVIKQTARGTLSKQTTVHTLMVDLEGKTGRCVVVENTEGGSQLDCDWEDKPIRRR